MVEGDNLVVGKMGPDNVLDMGHDVAWDGRQLVAVPIRSEVGSEVVMGWEGFLSWV